MERQNVSDAWFDPALSGMHLENVWRIYSAKATNKGQTQTQGAMLAKPMSDWHVKALFSSLMLTQRQF